MKSFTISSSAKSNSSLGSTLAALNSTQETSPKSWISRKTVSNFCVSAMSTLHVLTSTFRAVGRESRIVCRSSWSRVLERDIRATLLNFLAAKRAAVEEPIPAPLPTTTRVGDMLKLERSGGMYFEFRKPKPGRDGLL
jgi:hypothetical protein